MTVSYRNRGDETKRPRYSLRFYNGHGLLLGEKTVRGRVGLLGSDPSVDPGEMATTDLDVDWLPLDRITARSNMELPSDWRAVKWIVISDSNTMPDRSEE